MDSGRCVGVWDVSGKEWFLEGHFPGKPIVPGVLLTEALAQLGGLAVNTILEEGSAPVIGMLVASDIRFRTPVIPPASIDLETEITRSLGPVHQLKAEAKVDGTCCAEGTLSLHVGERA
jgi:3-hydroxyacyl-[acyl-carrier-protein] dehydratase